MTRRARVAILLPALAGLAALLFWGLTGLNDFGHYRGPYGFVLNRVALPERHTTNVVAATVFDYRGFDTLGEEFILFAAVLGVALLLREKDEQKDEQDADEVESDTLRLVGVGAVPVVLLLGLWLVAFGWITPGGGFQGGVVLAGGLLLVYLARSYRAYRRATPKPIVDAVEGIGVGGYAIVGLAALVSGMPFLTNLLGPGQPGTLLSGGSMAFLNWATALEVAAANLLLFSEFLEEYILPVRPLQ